MNKIEETRKFFIEKYGEPYEKMVDGRKYRFINVELQNFDKLTKLFQEVAASFEIGLKEELIAVICDFAKAEVQPNVVNVINKMERLAKERKNKINFGKKPFTRLLQSLEDFYNGESYCEKYIMNIFVKELRCANIYHKNNFTNIL